MREALPAFTNVQERILEALEHDGSDLSIDEGKEWDKTDGHLLKLIERGFIKELPNGRFSLVTDMMGEPTYKQTQWIL